MIIKLYNEKLAIVRLEIKRTTRVNLKKRNLSKIINKKLYTYIVIKHTGWLDEIEGHKKTECLLSRMTLQAHVFPSRKDERYTHTYTYTHTHIYTVVSEREARVQLALYIHYTRSLIRTYVSADDESMAPSRVSSETLRRGRGLGGRKIWDWYKAVFECEEIVKKKKFATNYSA